MASTDFVFRKQKKANDCSEDDDSEYFNLSDIACDTSDDDLIRKNTYVKTPELFELKEKLKRSLT